MKSVFKIQSTVTLKSGDDLEQEDFVAVNGGLLTAAQKVKEHHLRMRYRDSDNEWSDVTSVNPHHGSHICDLNVR